jgi:hypothetical protein
VLKIQLTFFKPDIMKRLLLTYEEEIVLEATLEVIARYGQARLPKRERKILIEVLLKLKSK